MVAPLILASLSLLISVIHGSPIERRLTTSGNVPNYVLQYAPITYLSINEQYWPSDLATHLSHLTAEHTVTGSNVTEPMVGAPYPLTLSNLNGSMIDSSTYLSLTTSGDMTGNSTASWLNAVYGKPDSSGRSAAATPIIISDKSDLVAPGVVDAFYFCFYSYNLGPSVFGTNMGNHVGDWEYSMVRFVNGTPSHLFVSAHSGGEVYAWSALQKEGVRPVTYSAVGSHANYATPGDHNITNGVPLEIVQDRTDAGVRWDVAANYNAWWYSGGTTSFIPASGNSLAANWLSPYAYWGDKQLPASDPRQQTILGFAKFGDGPTGPIDKSLSRTAVSWDPTVVTQTALPAVTSLISQSQAAAAARGAAGVRFQSPLLSLILIPTLVLTPSFVAAMLRLR